MHDDSSKVHRRSSPDIEQFVYCYSFYAIGVRGVNGTGKPSDLFVYIPLRVRVVSLLVGLVSSLYLPYDLLSRGRQPAFPSPRSKFLCPYLDCTIAL